jgi:hypothetical protein
VYCVLLRMAHLVKFEGHHAPCVALSSVPQELLQAQSLQGAVVCIMLHGAANCLSMLIFPAWLQATHVCIDAVARLYLQRSQNNALHSCLGNHVTRA